MMWPKDWLDVRWVIYNATVRFVSGGQGKAGAHRSPRRGRRKSEQPRCLYIVPFMETCVSEGNVCVGTGLRGETWAKRTTG